MQRRIYEIGRTSARPLSANDIESDLYHTADGGPVSAEKGVRVQVCRANGKLKAFGLRIRGRAGPSGGYRIEATPEPLMPAPTDDNTQRLRALFRSREC